MNTEKKKRAGLVIAVVVFAILILFAAFFVLIKKKIIHVNNLCVSVKDVVGVDISRYQGDVDMDVLAEQGISFVYIKATEGASHTDRMFQTNWANAKKSGMIRGAYHFFSFESSGVDQAKHYIEVVGELDYDMLPVVDVEFYGVTELNPPDKDAVLREFRACLDYLEEYYHVRPMIYTSRDIYKMYLDGEIDGYKLWVRSVFLPAAMEGWKKWTMWQYTDRAKLRGYSGAEQYIDKNVLNRNTRLEDILVIP